MSKYKYEGYGVIRDTEIDFPYHTDDIAELLEEKDQQISDLEAKLEEKEKEINYVYPFLKEYDNGIFTEYNVVYERDGIVATTCFGKNKEMAYEYLKTLRNDIKVVSQNQKAIEQLEKVKENIKKVPITDYDLSGNFEKIYKQDAIRQIDNQINELKGEKVG